MLQTIDISELLPGMYVTKVVKQLGTLTIKVEGKVSSESHLQSVVEQGVLEVEVDLSKSSHQTPETLAAEQAKQEFSEKLKDSLEVHSQAKSIQGRLLKRAAKGKLSNLEEVNEVTESIISQAFEQNDVFSAVTLVKEDVEYFLEHSINCAILIVLFGQHLGLEKSLLDKLGAGTLLMDIGMLQLPLLLTQKQQSFTPAEQSKMQTHIDIALKAVKKIEGLDPISLQIIEQHHERLDGSGYPKGISGDDISQYSRMAAIVDTYDSLITTRPHRNAMTPCDALAKLENEALGLDPHLVNQFIQCIGAYPVGSVVKLASDKLAMVTKTNKQSPLLPTVTVFYDIENKQDLVQQLDLANTQDKIVMGCALEDGSAGITQLLGMA